MEAKYAERKSIIVDHYFRAKNGESYPGTFVTATKFEFAPVAKVIESDVWDMVQKLRVPADGKARILTAKCDEDVPTGSWMSGIRVNVDGVNKKYGQETGRPSFKEIEKVF